MKKYKVQFFLYTKVIMIKVISERLIDKFWKEVGTFLFFYRTTKSKTSTKDSFTNLQLFYFFINGLTTLPWLTS